METVGPSFVVRAVIWPMTKALNPLIAKFAGRPHVRVFAQLRHTGRKSGRAYVTSVGARVSGDTIIIPLTFGNQSDWSRNVVAAGGCLITVRGKDYRATEPQFLDRRQAAPLAKAAFSPAERAGIRLFGTRLFMRLEATPAS